MIGILIRITLYSSSKYSISAGENQLKSAKFGVTVEKWYTLEISAKVRQDITGYLSCST